MFSVILYMLRQTVGRRALPLLFPSFFSSYCDVSQARSYFASTINMCFPKHVMRVRLSEPTKVICVLLLHFPISSFLSFSVSGLVARRQVSVEHDTIHMHTF
jgi:hypothetical protein